MPFTPFHFGPGAAIKALFPERFSLTLFCATQVVIDLETGYYLWRREYPVHRFLHTCLGATILGLSCAAAAVALCRMVRRLGRVALASPRAEKLERLLDMSWGKALTTSLIGTFSHVALDSLMHADIKPLAPFSADNPLLRLVGLPALHGTCVLLGLAGLLVMAFAAAQSRR